MIGAIGIALLVLGLLTGRVFLALDPLWYMRPATKRDLWCIVPTLAGGLLVVVSGLMLAWRWLP